MENIIYGWAESDMGMTEFPLMCCKLYNHGANSKLRTLRTSATPNNKSFKSPFLNSSLHRLLPGMSFM